jgi:hypothetical protein
MTKKRLDPRTFADAVAVNYAEERDSYVCAKHAPGDGKWTQKSNRSGIGAPEANAESTRFVEACSDRCAIWDADPANLVKRAVRRRICNFQEEKAKREGEKGQYSTYGHLNLPNISMEFRGQFQDCPHGHVLTESLICLDGFGKLERPEVKTVESLAAPDGTLNPLQQA